MFGFSFIDFNRIEVGFDLIFLWTYIGIWKFLGWMCYLGQGNGDFKESNVIVE